MYLYFNKEGKLTTAIPHGEPVRQGNALNLYICLDKDFFSSKKYNPEEWNMEVSTLLADGTPGDLQVSDSGTEIGPILFKFNKLIDSEAVYDLVPGKIYYRYHFKFDYEYSTKVSGVMKVQVSLYSLDEVNNFFGTAEIFVEKTFNFYNSIEDEEESQYIDYKKFSEEWKKLDLRIKELHSSPRRIFKVQRLKKFTEEEILSLTGPYGDLPIYIISGEYLELKGDTEPDSKFLYKCLNTVIIGEKTFEKGKYYYYENDQWNELINYEEEVGSCYLLKENGEYELIFYGRNLLWHNVEERVNKVIDERTRELVVFYDYTKEKEEE